ncbi:hypothetical protein UlMin_043316 [Ulmus minor]
MEDYLAFMKTLRSQMNDVEDQAAKLSVEEQTQLTTLETLENDLAAATSRTKQVKEESDRMFKAKGQMCSQILEKQKKIASLELDSSSLAQTLELMQQERISLSAKLKERSAYYNKLAEDLYLRLQQQQDWLNSHISNRQVEKLGEGKDNMDVQMDEIAGKPIFDNHLVLDNMENEMRRNLMAKLDSAQARLHEISEKKSTLVIENKKMKEALEQVEYRMNDFKPELREMDIKTLEEECNALLADKSGETEYLQSLQDQVEKLKGISHAVKCACGEEYRLCAVPSV